MLESDAGAAQPAGVAVAPPPAWAGFRTLTVTDVVAESALGDVVPVRRRTTRCRRTSPGSSSPCGCRAPATRCPVRTYSLSGDPDGGELPDQREARVARAGQLVPARAPATR